MSTVRVNGSTYNLKTNRHPRPLVSWYELPESERCNFTYLESDYQRESTRLFKYRGSWYDSLDFMNASPDVKAMGFDDVMAESMYSAILVTWYDRDGNELDDQIIVGYLYW